MSHESLQLLYLSSLPPPAGGISTWTRTLLDRGLSGGTRLRLVDTSVGGDRGVFVRGSLAYELRRTLRILRDFAKELVQRRPDLLHINSAVASPGLYRDWLCARLAARLGVTVVVHYHGRVLPDAGGWLRAKVRRDLAQRAQLNLALDRESELRLGELAAGRSRVTTLPNFFDEHELPRRPCPRRGETERLKALFAAGLIPAKGYRVVMAAARKAPEVDFHLYGRIYPKARAELEAAPGNVVCHGEVAHSELLTALQRAHVLVFPTRHAEGFPYVVCEAMAAGLPVVASPAGAIPEMVEAGSGGWIIEPDPEALAQALERLRQDEAKRLAMGTFNQEKAFREYAFEPVSRRLLALYQEIESPASPGENPRT